MWKAVVIAFVMSGSAPALAQDAAKKADGRADNCAYTLGAQAIQIPIGGTVCRRQPAPYNDKYSLLKCNPPLDEIDSDIRRGDTRCDRYDERE